MCEELTGTVFPKDMSLLDALAAYLDLMVCFVLAHLSSWKPSLTLFILATFEMSLVMMRRIIADGRRQHTVASLIPTQPTHHQPMMATMSS